MADKRLGNDLGEKLGGMPAARGIISSAHSVMLQSWEDTRAMSLSTAFKAVGNDPGTITWRIEVSWAGGAPSSSRGIWGWSRVAPVC